MIASNEIISLLVTSVPHVRATELVDQCRKRGMLEVPYQAIGLDSTLPPFEKGYHFRFNPGIKAQALFEILQKDGLILQAGYQLVFQPALFFSYDRKKHCELKAILEDHYGVGYPTEVGEGAEIINYGNDTTIAYISKVRVNRRDVITVRVGNRRFWNEKK